MALERERSNTHRRHVERSDELADQEREARRYLEESRRQLQEARAEQTRSESAALQKVNEARARVGLPAISEWSSEHGGMTPDGALLLFGGKSHKTFLGCFCDATEPDSILNSTGPFGPSGHRYESIWNRHSDYGSSYGDFSPCSTFAKTPPVVVSKAGQFFGYLTVDAFRDKAITDPAVVEWLKSVCDR
jgi:hypothetical protein